MNEIQLVKQCQQNDRQAQRALYDMHKDKLYTIAYRITGNTMDASDVLQESFIDAFKSIMSLSDVSSFFAWIKKMVIRKSYKLVTTKTDSRALEEASEVLSINPLDSDIEYIEKAIKVLPPKAKTVFLMAEVEGYSHREIAAQLEISEGTSKSQLHYAKTKLKSILTKHFEA